MGLPIHSLFLERSRVRESNRLLVLLKRKRNRSNKFAENVQVCRQRTLPYRLLEHQISSIRKLFYEKTPYTLQKDAWHNSLSKLSFNLNFSYRE